MKSVGCVATTKAITCAWPLLRFSTMLLCRGAKINYSDVLEPI